jgi:hypothetical protein
VSGTFAVMKRTLWLVAAVAGLAAGCGGDDGKGSGDAAVIDAVPIDSPDDQPIDAPPTDAPPDAPTDAAGCGTDLRFVGEYLDWDSTNAGFMGIGGAQWTAVGDLTRTTTTPPNGTVLLCLDPTASTQVTVSGPAPYLPALFLVDPAVFSVAGSRFVARGLKGGADAVSQFAEFGVTYNPALAQVLVYKLGAPIPLALGPAINPPQRSFVSDGANDITWTEGNSGTLTLFPNRPVAGGTATLTSTSTFTGPTTIPIAGGRFTIVVIR